VYPLTAEEKEAEKEWIDTNMGFRGLWRDGWIMYALCSPHGRKIIPHFIHLNNVKYGMVFMY